MEKALTESEMRSIFENMDSALAQEIRESYYKVSDGLNGLVDSLSAADDRLARELEIARKAMEDMSQSELGRVL